VKRAVVHTVVAAVALAFAGEAQACVCAALPMSDRLDDADAAIVGRVVAERAGEMRGAPQRLLTIEVDQRVKGDVDDRLVVRSPSMSDCDLLVARDEAVGLLLTRAPDGAWLGTACSVVDPGALAAAGGEPRGGAIKVVVGVLFLAIVVSWALRRRMRGTRPQLPGAPER
jgi:hypothetical protein